MIISALHTNCFFFLDFIFKMTCTSNCSTTESIIFPLQHVRRYSKFEVYTIASCLLLGALLNVLVIVYIIRCWRNRKVYHSLSLSMSCAFLLLSTLASSYYILHEYLSDGAKITLIIVAISQESLYENLILLLCIQQLIAVVKPLYAHTKITKGTSDKWVLLTIAVTMVAYAILIMVVFAVEDSWKMFIMIF